MRACEKARREEAAHINSDQRGKHGGGLFGTTTSEANWVPRGKLKTSILVGLHTDKLFHPLSFGSKRIIFCRNRHTPWTMDLTMACPFHYWSWENDLLTNRTLPRYIPFRIFSESECMWNNATNILNNNVRSYYTCFVIIEVLSFIPSLNTLKEIRAVLETNVGIGWQKNHTSLSLLVFTCAVRHPHIVNNIYKFVLIFLLYTKI